jgi:hypothetical protein
MLPSTATLNSSNPPLFPMSTPAPSAARPPVSVTPATVDAVFAGTLITRLRPAASMIVVRAPAALLALRPAPMIVLLLRRTSSPSVSLYTPAGRAIELP